ncbi:MAG TPA: flagellar basal body rod protein FlgC [Alphaproteobacteria bacterium]
MDLINAIKISASGMKAQGTRLRVISENIANTNSLAETPGGEPYRRKLVTFQNVLDRELRADLVKVSRIGFDNSEFSKRFDPTHPAADAEGYVLTPNVNGLIEMMDMREAQRSYDANLNLVEASKRMIERTIDLMRD